MDAKSNFCKLAILCDNIDMDVQRLQAFLYMQSSSLPIIPICNMRKYLKCIIISYNKEQLVTTYSKKMISLQTVTEIRKMTLRLDWFYFLTKKILD